MYFQRQKLDSSSGLASESKRDHKDEWGAMEMMPERRQSSENRYANSANPSTTTDRFIAIPAQVQ
jgi:hypothetical protein